MVNLTNLSPLILCRLLLGIKIFGRGGGGAKNDSLHRALILLGTALCVCTYSQNCTYVVEVAIECAFAYRLFDTHVTSRFFFVSIVFAFIYSRYYNKIIHSCRLLCQIRLFVCFCENKSPEHFKIVLFFNERSMLSVSFTSSTLSSSQQSS